MGAGISPAVPGIKETITMRTGTSGTDTLITALSSELEKGITAIRQTDEVTYRRTGNGSGSVGDQFRHILDFITCLLRGVEQGRIDYSNRPRDTRIATDREYAALQASTIQRELEAMEPGALASSLSVRSEINTDVWLPACFAREVEFVHSHTVHHLALIAEKLAGYGVRVDGALGVSPSTAEYRRRAAA
jgi:hypothetical protein